ncbi:uncharacterized protein zgc:66455 isoform X2 [Boleophthalmus pectinirostris]|uniref:uncharacterized protein zgc:66455 isoform X2 n=1 Tax=Boleophthalmus pectinirostris TaxID=150288 RepID=UPI00242E931B|nr:uncharacterized protein zgc:66455 isoform X2 [Boleophthalmus pectinirostris]
MFVMKMPPRRRKKRSFESVIFLITFGLQLCHAQISNEEDTGPSSADHSTAFFALRSCHQVLGGESGLFFSPDYLCSNPPLWCNWTIQVHPGKRIHLQLNDLTPDDDCLWRRDQIHIDEPESQSQKHSVLQKCWREATYTSSSNTVHVVLLIEGSPTPTYRGFHGQYQAFGPPQIYNPQDPAHSPIESSENISDYSEETVETNSQTEDRTNDDEVNVTDEALSDSEIPVYATEWSPDPQQEHRPSPRVFTAIRRDVETNRAMDQSDQSDQSEEETISEADDGILEELEEELNKNWEVDSETVLEKTALPFDHRAETGAHAKYHSLHLPGDLLFEVSVEVNVSRDSEPWNDVARTLLLSTQNLIKNQLKPTFVSRSISSKRIKRLNAGVLFILWLQMGPRTSGHHAHEEVHSDLLKLIGSRLGLKPTQEDSVVMSLSTADVNECHTQLMACDPNADCVNHFGSYSCLCRTGFQDRSRSGTGTVCVGTTNTDCSPALSSEAKAVYILFFLLSTLVLSLLVLIGLFYHRHRRGHFLVPPSDPNNNSNGNHDDIDLPPPPPPRCPPVDLQLLRYNTILPHEPKS